MKNASWLTTLPPRFERVGFAQGLSHGAVHAIAQDKLGFLWFATEDGLHRYDGYTMKVYAPISGDTTSLCHEFVRSLYVDRLGVLWVGTHDGLCRYNERSDNFTRFQYNARNPHSISSDNVTFIHEDREGVLWFATNGGGLNAFDRSTQRFRAYRHDPANPNSVGSDDLWTICEDRTGGLWLGTQEAGVCRLDKKTEVFTQYPSVPNDSTSLGRPTVWAIHEDRTGNVWVGTWGAGLHRFCPATAAAPAHWKRYPCRLRSADVLSLNTILCIQEDANGVLWLGTRGGVMQFHPATQQCSVFQSDATNPESVSNDVVWRIFADRSGNVWCGTENGISKYCRYNQRFVTFHHHPHLPFSISSNNVHALYEDAQGMVWVGTWGGGLNKLNPYAANFTVFTNDPANPNSLSQNAIWAIDGDARGALWIGTTQGLNRFEPTTGRWTRYLHREGDANSLIHDYVKSVYVDKSGAVWVGTSQRGLDKFVPQASQASQMTQTTQPARQAVTVAGQWTHFQHNPANANSISSNRITAILETRDGAMWVGTYGQGLNRFDQRRNTWTRFASNVRDTTMLSDSVVTALYQDSSGVLWVGTMRGLHSIELSNNGMKQSFKRYAAGSVSATERICGIAEDAHGYFWISTFKGMLRFQPSSGNVQRFGVEDGLQDNKFNNRSVLRLRSGELMFGGVNGLSLFHPDSMTINQHLPSVVITGFKKSNRAASFDSNIVVKRTIDVEYSDYAIAIEFTGLEFSQPAHNLYAYMLEGVDNGWVYTTTQRSAQYTNLSPGRYVFCVKASNGDGVWNPNGARLTIVVHPPWWRTWWAFGVYAMLLAFAVELIIRWRGERQRRQFIFEQQRREAELVRHANEQLSDANEELQRLNAEKNDILNIVAHDMKNPLSAVMLHAELIHDMSNELAEGEQRQQIQESARGIGDLSERMFDMVKNLLEANAIGEGRLKLEVLPLDLADMCHFALGAYRPRAVEKSITIHIESPPNGVIVLADARATMQIIDNLLSNALKYSPPNRTVWLYVHQTYRTFNALHTVAAETAENTEPPNVGAKVDAVAHFARSVPVVCLVIRDEGPGISAEDQEKLFTKFAQLSAKPTGGEHSTGLGLAIVKKLADAMSCRVWCESELGKGTTFAVEFPVPIANSVSSTSDAAIIETAEQARMNPEQV